MNILLAEDNRDDIYLVELALKKAQVSSVLRTVSDGTEVIAYLQGEGEYHNREANPLPDVLLLDLNMPRMNGFEVLEWVRNDPRFSRLIVHVLSSSCREVDIRRAYDLRANTYVMKPSRIDELTRFIVSMHQWHAFSCWPQIGGCPEVTALAKH